MKKALIFSMFLFSISANAEKITQDNSITFHNSSEFSKQIWISGEPRTINSENSLRLPCFAGESVYIQTDKNTEILSCGTKKVINNEY